MNTEAILDHLDRSDFFDHGLGMPVHASGRYAHFRVAITLVMLSTRKNLKIAFEHMELNDPSMLKMHDELYHATACLDGDEQIFHRATQTMTPDEMRGVIQTVLGQLGDPAVETVLF